MMKPAILPMQEYLLGLQQELADILTQLDPQLKVTKDQWERAEGGGGLSLAFSQGKLFEKAGVNYSHIWGNELPASASAMRPELKNKTFQAVGISIIIHPLNPYIPTCHANLRLFLAENLEETVWWFGGGFDLTPYYGFDEDCIHWHRTAKHACDPFGKNIYAEFKKWADDYFHLKHRNESRGIGGIFFDDLNRWDFTTCLSFIKSVGKHFIAAYFPIVERRKKLSYGEQERQFQCYRRGRYVEFNLVYDRGTLFGLQSGGRTESILISLPPLVSWQYNWHPAPGTKEAELYNRYLQPKEWANERD